MSDMLLAISSNSREIYNYAEKTDYTNSKGEIIFWVIALILIIAICLFATLGWPKVKAKLMTNKEKKNELRQIENQKLELERLHKIKEKNKRK